jgi:hypothetical protein
MAALCAASALAIAGPERGAGATKTRESGGPRILFLDQQSGPDQGGPRGLGVPISIYGQGFGARQGASFVTIGGRRVARYLVWGHRNAPNPALDLIVVQPGPKARSGPVVVTVSGRRSNADEVFRVRPGRILAVSTKGTDNRKCSLEKPCATILHAAMDVMKPGDTLLVSGGKYAESEVWIRGDQGGSGTAADPKTIKSYPCETVTLTNPDRPVIVDADYITLAGLHFTHGKTTGVADADPPGHKGDRFVANTFSGKIDWAAIGTTGNDHLLAGNVCRVSGSTVGTEGHCFYISYGRGVKLLYNVASGAPGYGIHVFDQKRSDHDFRRVISDLLIEGNLLESSSQRSGLILAMDDEGHLGNEIRRVTIRDNTFTHNNFVGLQIESNVHEVRVTGNHFVQNGRQGISIDGDPAISGVTISGNTIVQSKNSYCHVDCSWYRPAHIQLGSGARSVTISGNVYEPWPPVIVGGSDRKPLRK